MLCFNHFFALLHTLLHTLTLTGGLRPQTPAREHSPLDPVGTGFQPA